MKGIKKAIDKTSFNKSTLKGFIRKGFVGIVDFDKTKLTDYTKSKLTDFIKSQDEKKKTVDLFFVRDKQVVFCLDTKSKIVYDCQSTLGAYFDYFVKQNSDYKIEKLENIHPTDLRARGLSVDKLANESGFCL